MLLNNKIGTHNSMSYLNPAKWWLRLFRFTYKCQSLTLEEQLNCGVKIFDLRIRLNKNNEWVFAHGLVEFKGITPLNALKLIDDFAKQHNELYKVRLMWETQSNDNMSEANEFVNLCYLLETSFTNIKFFGGTSISTWRNWYNFHPYGKNDDRWEFNTEQFVSSLSSFEICGLWPWLYTIVFKNKLFNKAKHSTADIVLLDFINKNDLNNDI